MAVSNAALSFINCNFTSNKAVSLGGVFYLDDFSTISLQGSTVNGATAGSRGGCVYLDKVRMSQQLLIIIILQKYSSFFAFYLCAVVDNEHKQQHTYVVCQWQ